jgi:FeS assembly SUF system protein
MRWCAHSRASGSYWGNHMSMFSFLADLTGKKDEAALPDTSSDTPFIPPDAWTSESMAAPKPETAHDGLQVGPLDPEQTGALQGKIVEAIKTVFDPEIPVDIYELGLIYDIIVDADRNVLVNMTLTSPACPSAQQLPVEVRHKVRSIPEVADARVEIVWEPAWGKERMSEAAKLTLGFF